MIEERAGFNVLRSRALNLSVGYQRSTINDESSLNVNLCIDMWRESHKLWNFIRYTNLTRLEST